MDEVNTIKIKVGPRGGTLGDSWEEGGLEAMSHILIYHGESINSIQVVWDDSLDYALLDRRGGAGDKFDIVDVKSYTLTQVSGHYGHHMNDKEQPVVVRSLKFGATGFMMDKYKEFGPFVCEEGTPFSFKFEHGAMFSGFHGRSDDNFLHAIGVIVLLILKARREF